MFLVLVIGVAVLTAAIFPTASFQTSPSDTKGKSTANGGDCTKYAERDRFTFGTDIIGNRVETTGKEGSSGPACGGECLC